MKRNLLVRGAVVLLVLALAGCNLFTNTDPIVGSWQLASRDGVNAILITVAQFTESTYTDSTAGIIVNSGTWTRSGSAYTLNGSFFGFIGSSTTITPIFSSSNNTLTYTDGDGYVVIYNRQ